jgi:D-alanyl-D-alanine carboxypeptidase
MEEGDTEEVALAKVMESVAVPGTSEHHLGLAADIGGGEAMYAWMRDNSWKYGFIVRYPEGKTEYTGIIYEPWHIRYVGVELAKELHDLGLCMEEYMEMITKK